MPKPEQDSEGQDRQAQPDSIACFSILANDAESLPLGLGLKLEAHDIT